MALPIDGRAINNIIAMTLNAQLPELTDNFFNTNALLLRILQKSAEGIETIKYDGGTEIRSAIIYNGMPAYAYTRGSTFGTAQQEFATTLQFDWKQLAAELNAEHLDVAKNGRSESKIIDYATTMAVNATNSLYNRLAYAIFGTLPDPVTGLTVVNPTPTIDPIKNAPTFDGLYNAILDSGVYGAITRGGNLGTPGFAIISNVLAGVAVPISLGLMQQAYGSATFTPDQPDLIVTTQKIWNQIWARVQPQDRNPPGPLREVGFRTIRFNGAEVIQDSHCLPGNMYFLNSKYWQLWLMEGYDFIRRGKQFGELGFPVFNQDAFVDQLIVYGDLVCPGPRYQALITGIVEG